jgi:diguanylate cyclase (GGDEF)-like protein
MLTAGRVASGILSPHLSRRPFILAGFAAVLIITVTIALAPFGKLPCLAIPTIVAIYATMMTVVEALTAYFLAIQFSSCREPLLGALAGAFGYVAVLVFSQLLVFPGIFCATGLLGGGPQSSIWMWTFWHAGFPIFVLAGLLLHKCGRLPGMAALSEKIGLALISGGPIIAIFIGYACVAHGKSFPSLISGASYQGLRHSAAVPVIVGATILALIACVWFTRLRDMLSLWLAIALLASLADAALTLSGAVRFDLGWYSGRALSIVAFSVVFCVIMAELSRLNHRLVEANTQLAESVMRDGLTGAFNRRYFSEQFPREVRRAKRESNELSLLIIDVDHFKNFNDLHGHQQGDECLITVVTAIQDVAGRPGDFVARYGGEEFVVLLPQTDISGARLLAEKIRCKVAALNFISEDRSAHAVTVSIGLETLSPASYSCSPEELLKRADQALYRAKHQGRNAVRWYEPHLNLQSDSQLPVPV